MGKGNRRKSAAGKAKPVAGPSASGAAATRKRKHSSEEHEVRPTAPAPTASTPARGTKRKAQDEPPASAPSPRRSRRLSGVAPAEPERQPAARQYQPGDRTSRGNAPYAHSGYDASEEEEGQGSPGIQDPSGLNHPGGGGNGRGPSGDAPPGGDGNPSSNGSSSTRNSQPSRPAQNDLSSASDSSDVSEKSDWGSDIEPLDESGDLSGPGFMFVVRNELRPLDPEEYVEQQRVCLRMTSGDPLNQGWEMANYLTVRGNPHRLARGLLNLEKIDEEVESREHLPVRQVLEEIARTTRNRPFRSRSELQQATNPDVAWGFEVNVYYGLFSVYGPPRVGDLARRVNFFKDALVQDEGRVPELIHRYWFAELRGFDSAENFRRDVFSRFSPEAAEQYGISPQGLQDLHNPAELDEAQSESTSPYLATPSSTNDRETLNGHPAASPIPTYTTNPAPWGRVSGPNNQMTDGAPPMPENRPGALLGHYDDSGYTDGQGGTDPGSHTTNTPPLRPQNPHLPFPGGYYGGAVGGVPPGQRIRYTDDPDSGDKNECEKPSRPLPPLRQYPQHDRPATWDNSGVLPSPPERPQSPRVSSEPSNYAGYAPTSPNQGYSPIHRSEDRGSQDGSNVSTEILDQNDGGAAPGPHSPVVYQTYRPPVEVFTQQPTAGDDAGQEAGNAFDPGHENIPPFYRFDTVRPPPGPRTPLPVYDPLLQYRDYRPINFDSDSSDSTVVLRREPYGDDDGSPTLRVRASIRQNADRTVYSSPETPPFRRGRGIPRRRPHTMSPGAIRETIKHDSEEEDTQPVQRTRYTLSPEALRRRIFKDDLPDLGSSARAATEDDLPDYESDPYELPPLERGRASSPGEPRFSSFDASPGTSPDASPGPPDSARQAHDLSPKETGYAADDSDSDSDSDDSSDDSVGPPDSARPPRSPDAPPASPARRPSLEREAQEADAAQSYPALLEPTPAPARENEEVIFRDPGWDSPSREPVDEDVDPRTMSPPVGRGYTHEDAYPHPPPSTDKDNEDQEVDSSVEKSNYEALLAEEQRLRQEYAALLEEQSRQPAGAQRMLVSADYYSSPEPEEHLSTRQVAAGNER